MAKLGVGASIFISVILGIIFLSILGVSGIFSLIIIGFVATYLTAPSQRTYKAGGIAGIIIAFLIFIYGLFISPNLPVNPPSISSFTWISLELSGFLNLILGLIVSIIVCFLFGSLGSFAAQKLLKKEIVKPKAHTRENSKSEPNKKSRRSLNRSYKN